MICLSFDFVDKIVLKVDIVLFPFSIFFSVPVEIVMLEIKRRLYNRPMFIFHTRNHWVVLDRMSSSIKDTGK
jgi:hypothetical protein